MCEENNHNYIYQDTSRRSIVKDETGRHDYYCTYTRIDRYYCTKCLDIKEIKKETTIRLPFGGINHVKDFAPEWYR